MSTTAQFRLVAPVQSVPAPMPDTVGEQIVNVTLESDERLLLSVVEAARRLDIGRTLMYELLGSGQIESVHVGRLHKVPASALVTFVDQRIKREVAVAVSPTS